MGIFATLEAVKATSGWTDSGWPSFVCEMDLLSRLQVEHVQPGHAVKIRELDDLLEQDLKIGERRTRCGGAAEGQCDGAVGWRAQGVFDKVTARSMSRVWPGVPGIKLMVPGMGWAGREAYRSGGDLILQVARAAVPRMVLLERDICRGGLAVPQVIPKSAPEGGAGAGQVGGGQHAVHVKLEADHAGDDENG